MARRRESKAQTAEIDMSPLIDMVFILLIFFMVSTTFVKDMKVDLERPGASSATRASNKEVRVTIDASQTIYIDGNPVRPWMVQSRVRDLLEAAGHGMVLVVTDRNVPVDRLIEVVDQCRLAGASDVGVATEQEAG
jgi:biopolymer transport protein ExbD